MKTKFTLIKAFIIVVISSIAITASAQAPTPPPAPTPFTGPTISTNVPSASIPVDHFICSGGQVSLISPTSGVTNYLWWKQQTSTTGPWVLVGNTPAPTNTYTETSSTPGYYTYKVQTENALGCESPISNPINIFALPPIVSTITPPMNVCQSITSIPAPFALTVTPNDYGGTYTYTYQWFRDNGSGPIDLPGATSPTISNLTETTPGTVTYGVRISYATALGQSTGTTTCMVTKTTQVTVVSAPVTPVIQWN